MGMRNLKEQIERINQITNYKVGVIITEQDLTNKVVTQVERFTTPESKKVNNIFMTEFLPTLTPNRNEMLVSDYINKLKNLTDVQLKSVIEFFTKKGYKQPNEDIKKFQQDILRVTGVDKFTNKEQINNEFKDGVFGIATSRAVIGSFIENLEKVIKKEPNKTVGDTFSQTNVNLTDRGATQKTVSAPTKVAGKTVNINVGTQGIK